ncbi:hypothetical protein, partial [Bacillus wiedmannii]|uniref:hypothetical protein n=1 Tax=Bacillus wiedmannii TaxID=1890302 RepID=UPI001C3F0B54
QEPVSTVCLDGGENIEDAVDTGCAPDRHMIGPGDDGRVPNIVIDYATMPPDGPGIDRKQFAQIFLRAQVSISGDR